MKEDIFSTDEYLSKLNEYFNACNYLTVTQLYLLDNPLLVRPLQMSDIKRKLVGHWGTCAGQNFVYAHCDRVINKFDQDMILISGPGHGGNFFVANSYLEGSYSKYYPQVSEDEKGLTRLCKQFSFPYGIPSHVAPETPGSINEGGELGYCLFHACGAVLDNPNLIATTIVGDGEAETGPLATSWFCNKFINPVTDGAVLPVLHLNGYKISNPTVLSRLSKKEITSLFEGYGYEPHFVEGSNPMTMHTLMAQTMDECITKIHDIQSKARAGKLKTRPVWPMIILRTPKGWTGPKVVDGKQVEGSFRAHQVPLTIANENDLRILEKWLKSYHPESLFRDFKLRADIKAILPKGKKRMSDSPYCNGGLLLKNLKTPNIFKYAVKFDAPGQIKTQDMLELGGYIRDLYKLNPTNYRIFSPDEAMSNRLYRVFETQNRDFNLDILKTDDCLADNGRIMDSFLSEHMCEGVLEGYLLTGRHGMFDSYESFARIVDSMLAQHAKWLKVCNEISWRAPISSLNLILTSHVWQQDHNGYTHQDPGMLDHLANKKADVVRIYLPADANCLISCYDHCAKSKNYINAIVASKHPSYQWLTMEQAVEHCTRGAGVWNFACLNDAKKPDIVLACAGDTPTLEMLACVKLVQKYLPKLNVRFVNVVDLFKLQDQRHHAHGLTQDEYDALFTKDKPIIFNFHGYPHLIHELTYDRHNRDIHVSGYREEGTITTPFDMRVRNNIDRFNLMKQVAKYAKISKKDRERINADMDEMLARHKAYIAEYGVDMPEIADWKW